MAQSPTAYHRADTQRSPVGIVLAGGESRRMGRDKALLCIDGRTTLLERSVAALRSAGLEHIALSVSTQARGLALRAAVPAIADIPLVSDAVPGRGPLGGLHAALQAFPGCHVLLVACDMPHLDVAALRAILAEPRDTDALVPRLAGYDQPLHALYGPACLPVSVRLLAESRLAMRNLLTAPELHVRILDETWMRHHGLRAAGFDNVNTPDDVNVLLGAGRYAPGHG